MLLVVFVLCVHIHMYAFQEGCVEYVDVNEENNCIIALREGKIVRGQVGILVCLFVLTCCFKAWAECQFELQCNSLLFFVCMCLGFFLTREWIQPNP
jgi:hypothetical protein